MSIDIPIIPINFPFSVPIDQCPPAESGSTALPTDLNFVSSNHKFPTPSNKLIQRRKNTRKRSIRENKSTSDISFLFRNATGKRPGAYPQYFTEKKLLGLVKSGHH